MRPGDKSSDPLSYPMVGLPEGVEYDPKKHNKGIVCVDCLLDIRYERYLKEEEDITNAINAMEEKNTAGAMSEETIKREVASGRLTEREALYEFMALMKTKVK
jgi:hypothetical protein